MFLNLDIPPYSFSQLPPEILHDIFRYLDIPDILRLRRVSRYLNRVTRCRDVWSDAYRSARYVHPPGPFPSQTAHDLERLLVPSFRLSQNMRGDHGPGTPPRRARVNKFREICYTGMAIRVCLAFGGRFLLIAVKEEVRCYDLSLDVFDSNSGANIICRPAHGTLTSFHCASAIDLDGHPSVCAVSTERAHTGKDTTVSVSLLNVTEQSEVTLDLLHQFEHYTFEVLQVVLGPRVILIEGRAGTDAETGWCLVALDVRMRTQLLIPSFIDTTLKAPEIPWTTIEEITSPTSISTSTHLLLTRSFYTKATGWCTFIQAFPLPHTTPDTYRGFIIPSTPNSNILSPSHRGIISGIQIDNVALLHDTMIDSSTQDILVTLRLKMFEASRPRASQCKYGIIRLARRLQAQVQPGDQHEVDLDLGTVTFEPLGHFVRTPILHPSFHGAAWAFHIHSSCLLQAIEYDVQHGSDDVTKATKYPCILALQAPRTLLDYDPYSGRLCLQSSMARYSVIDIMDLAI